MRIFEKDPHDLKNKCSIYVDNLPRWIGTLYLAQYSTSNLLVMTTTH